MNPLIEHSIRSSTQAIGQCLIWTGLPLSGTPERSLKGQAQRARRYLRKEAGLEIIEGKRLRTKCLNPRCVAPACSAYGDDSARLAARIEQKTDRANSNGCRRWLGSHNTDGYAVIRHKGKTLLVTRLLLVAQGMKLFPEDEASHLCEVPGCCNVAHLMPASSAMNQIFRVLQVNPATRMTIEQAREWHRIEYPKYRPFPPR